MGARWTQKGSAYITDDTKIIPYYPSKKLEMHSRMLKRDGSFPIERMTSSHAPLGIRNTTDGYEAYLAPSPRQLRFPSTGRNFLIEAIRGERKGRQWKHALLQTGCVI